MATYLALVSAEIDYGNPLVLSGADYVTPYRLEPGWKLNVAMPNVSPLADSLYDDVAEEFGIVIGTDDDNDDANIFGGNYATGIYNAVAELARIDTLLSRWSRDEGPHIELLYQPNGSDTLQRARITGADGQKSVVTLPANFNDAALGAFLKGVRLRFKREGGWRDPEVTGPEASFGLATAKNYQWTDVPAGFLSPARLLLNGITNTAATGKRCWIATVGRHDRILFISSALAAGTPGWTSLPDNNARFGAIARFTAPFGGDFYWQSNPLGLPYIYAPGEELYYRSAKRMMFLASVRNSGAADATFAIEVRSPTATEVTNGVTVAAGSGAQIIAFDPVSLPPNAGTLVLDGKSSMSGQVFDVQWICGVVLENGDATVQSFTVPAAGSGSFIHLRHNIERGEPPTITRENDQQQATASMGEDATPVYAYGTDMCIAVMIGGSNVDPAIWQPTGMNITMTGYITPTHPTPR